MKKSLLLNHVTWKPVGHALEAIQAAKGLSINKNLEIHVALNDKTAYELAEGCNWIKKTYPINVAQAIQLGAKAPCYNFIPKKWNYIVNDQRDNYFHPHYAACDSIFECIDGKGSIYGNYDPPQGLKYRYSKTIIDIPENSRDEIKKFDHSGLKICLLLAGSGPKGNYPSADSWIEIISAINRQYSNCIIYITGITKSEKDRTITKAFSLNDVTKIVSSFPNVKNMYNIGLWDQAALLELCDVLISPHTGFAFLAPRVNTPWLEIAEGGWKRYLWNGLPFYTVFPDDPNYPYLMETPDEIEAMKPSKLRKKIPDILAGLSFLLNPKSTYQESVDLYIKKAEESNIILSRMGLNYFPWYSPRSKKFLPRITASND